MSNRNYSVITNFGCHFKCPYCITKQTGLKLPKTDLVDVCFTIGTLIKSNAISFLSFSGGGDPMYNINNLTISWYNTILDSCQKHGIETEMHTSAYCINEYKNDDIVLSMLGRFDRVVFHCACIGQIEKVALICPKTTTLRVVFVVTPGMTRSHIDLVRRSVYSWSIKELTFRQMVNNDFSTDETLKDYLRNGHERGLWHYTEQADYNRYIVNDRIYDRFEDIVRSGRALIGGGDDE